jgi:hypothetical protein
MNIKYENFRKGKYIVTVDKMPEELGKGLDTMIKFCGYVNKDKS